MEFEVLRLKAKAVPEPEKKWCPGKVVNVCKFAGPGCSFNNAKDCIFFKEIVNNIKERFKKGEWEEKCIILVLEGYSNHNCDLIPLKKKYKGQCWEEDNGEIICRVREDFQEKVISYLKTGYF